MCDVSSHSVVNVLLADVMHKPVQLKGPVQLLVVDDTFLVRSLMVYVDRLPNKKVISKYYCLNMSIKTEQIELGINKKNIYT